MFNDKEVAMNNMQLDLRKIIILFAIILVGTTSMQQAFGTETKGKSNPTYYKYVEIDGVDELVVNDRGHLYAGPHQTILELQ